MSHGKCDIVLPRSRRRARSAAGADGRAGVGALYCRRVGAALRRQTRSDRPAERESGRPYAETRGSQFVQAGRGSRAYLFRMTAMRNGGMSRDARLMIGLSLILVPTIVYGGVTMLGVVTGGAFGAPGPEGLTAVQVALYRAGHAHAGVLLILSLVLQIALDHARLGRGAMWSARLAGPAAALLVSGGFFGLAHAPALRAALYAGALCVALAALLTGVGLLRRAPRPTS